MSIGQIQIQLAHKVSGRNGIPTALLNLTSVKQNPKRTSVMQQQKSPLSSSVSFIQTRTPATKNPGPSMQLQMMTPSNKYRTIKTKGQKTVLNYVNQPLSVPDKAPEPKVINKSTIFSPSVIANRGSVSKQVPPERQSVQEMAGNFIA